MITGKVADPYCSDGTCKNCGQWYFVLTLEEHKVRNGVCQKCQRKIELTFRRLIVDNKPYVCGYCGRDPVYIEREPGSAIFVIEKGKINRHSCDLVARKKPKHLELVP